MYVFLLAGSEVVLSAVVLASCNFLFIKTKPSVPADKLENVDVADSSATAEVCSKAVEGNDEEEKGAREEQEKETVKDSKEEEEEKVTDKEEEVRPESVTVDSREVERFLKEPQQNGDVATNPETSL